MKAVFLSRLLLFPRNPVDVSSELEKTAASSLKLSKESSMKRASGILAGAMENNRLGQGRTASTEASLQAVTA